jgi:hypothetical protein
MLKYRLIFGTLMIIFFIAVLVFGGWLDDTLADHALVQSTICDNSPKLPVKGTIFCIIIAIVAIPAQLELRKLIKNTGAHIFLPIAIIASILLATGNTSHKLLTSGHIPIPVFMSRCHYSRCKPKPLLSFSPFRCC